MVSLNSSKEEEEEEKKEVKLRLMAMGPERSSASSSSSKPLHNFTLPCGLRWGNQKFLRCMKVNSNGEISAVQRRPSSSSSSHLSEIANNASNGNGNGNSNADFGPIIGKRKEREKLDDPDGGPADYRRRSEFKKVGLSFKPAPSPLPPSGMNTESGRQIRSGENGGGGEDGDGIAAVREKLMFDIQTAADKMKDAILWEGLETEEQDNPPSSAPAIVATTVTVSETVEGALRPWNLRTRRAACRVPTANGISSGGAGTSNGAGGSSPAKILKVVSRKPNSGLSPSRSVAENNKSTMTRNGIVATASPSNEKKERVKFSVALTRREIEEDFMAIAGRRPSRRPQKRPKHIQKQLDALFPGLWLSEITADMYKVPETQ